MAGCGGCKFYNDSDGCTLVSCFFYKDIKKTRIKIKRNKNRIPFYRGIVLKKNKEKIFIECTKEIKDEAI